ncbi:cytochrome P450 [Mycena rebaudengoi]|nr:cytochrome P450 [Mycena rebaudengoi]
MPTRASLPSPPYNPLMSWWNVPGLRSLFSPSSLFGVLIPTFYFNPGPNWQWMWRNQVYSKHGVQTMSVLPYISGRPHIFTRSMNVARQVVSVKGQFKKPDEVYSLFALWGRNMFTENGAEWSRHRRILNPAFAPEMYGLEMMQAEGWRKKSDFKLSDIHPITTKLALTLISRCGFGAPLAWNGNRSSQSESIMNFAEALGLVSETHIIRLITPRWMYKLPIKRLHAIEAAHTYLTDYMQQLVVARKNELSGEFEERKDLFRLMIRAREGEGTLRMSDGELIGNTFVMLLAGHETTAKTLDATIGFLALYEEIQEEVYQAIQKVVSNDGKLHLGDYSRLGKVRACFLEAARLFPPAHTLYRETTESVVLKTDEEDGHGGEITLEPGTRVAVDVVGLHYNPKYFPEPEEFLPDRWYEVPESDLSMFSLGPRACIGRRFALTKGVAFLSHLLNDWKLHIILNPGESRAQWRKRVMTGTTAMTLGIGKVPVRLTRR